MSSPISHTSACGYRLSAVLGKGATGTVYLGCDGRSTAAVKVVDKCKLPAASRPAVIQEAAALRSLSHTSILPLISYAENDAHVAIATLHCADGDLLDLLNHKRGIPEHEAANIFAKLVSALVYSHSQGWAHRDIKPENVLLDNNEVYLADWGSAVRTRRNMHCVGFAGTDAYAAPEVRDSPSYCPFAADIWSLGATLFVACAASLPFPCDSERHCRGMIGIPSHFSAELQELLHGCLAPAHKRWTIEQLRQCSWFAVHGCSPPLYFSYSVNAAPSFAVRSAKLASFSYSVARSPRVAAFAHQPLTIHS